MTDTPLTDHAAEGIATMDREHEVELQLVRDLQAALRSGDHAAASTLVERLEDFTAMHFLAEQLLMRLHAYPGSMAHQEEHDRLIGDLRAFRARLEAGSLADPAEEADGLEVWLQAHMASSDRALGDYLRAAPSRVFDGE